MASYVWDILLLDGEITLYVAGVAILNIVSQQILPTKARRCRGPLLTLRSEQKSWLTSRPLQQYEVLNSQQNSEDLASLNDNSGDDEEVAVHRAFDRIRWETIINWENFDKLSSYDPKWLFVRQNTAEIVMFLLSAPGMFWLIFVILLLTKATYWKWWPPLKKIYLPTYYGTSN